MPKQKCLAKKTSSLFPLMDRNKHPSCKFYKGDCLCEEMYISETKRNVAIRWRKHEKFNGESEPAKHLTKFPKHSFKYSLQATT